MRIIAVSILSILTMLSGCTALNAYTGAAINAGESGYAGARQNVQAVDDAAFVGWNDAACAIKLGALKRNATGNPNAVKAVLTACPVSNVAVITSTDGTITLMAPSVVTAPTITPGFVPPVK